MQRVGAVVLAILSGMVLWSCENSDPSAPFAPVATIRPNMVVTVTAASSQVTPGQTLQFTATAHYSNDTTQNVTALATWQSSSSSVATVSNTGLATAISPGDTVIQAAYQNVSGGVRITVATP
jgi:uncharacterized protein YjdB